MNNNRPPFGVAMGFSLLTLFVSVVLFEMMPGLSELLQESGLSPSLPFFLCLLLALLVGLLIWLNLKLSIYDAMISDLKSQIRALEEKLDTTKKD